MPTWFQKSSILLLLAGTVFAPARGIGGSPFITDDPAFSQGWEITVASIYEKFSGEETLTAPLVDLNYAPIDHLQLNATIAQKSVFIEDGPDETGISDTDLKIKWRIVDEEEDTWIPALSIAPVVTLPTASKSRGLGDGVWRTRMTAQIAKTFGPFYTYAETGYQWAFGDHDHVLYGYVVQYDLTERWNIGAEISGNMPMVGVDNHGAIANLGVSYALSDNCQLQASVGRTIRNDSRGGPKLLLQMFVQWTF